MLQLLEVNFILWARKGFSSLGIAESIMAPLIWVPSILTIAGNDSIAGARRRRGIVSRLNHPGRQNPSKQSTERKTEATTSGQSSTPIRVRRIWRHRHNEGNSQQQHNNFFGGHFLSRFPPFSEIPNLRPLLSSNQKSISIDLARLFLLYYHSWPNYLFKKTRKTFSSLKKGVSPGPWDSRIRGPGRPAWNPKALISPGISTDMSPDLRQLALTLTDGRFHRPLIVCGLHPRCLRRCL
jgi:hypothetical protein